MLPEIVAAMPWTSSFTVSHAPGSRSVTVADSSRGTDSATAFSAAFQELVDRCIGTDAFRVLDKQHSELFSLLSWSTSPTFSNSTTINSASNFNRDEPLSSPISSPRPKIPVVIERFAAPLFGITLSGAHMIAYVKSRATEDDSGVISGLWIPRRAAHLWSSPNMLDASVAGGIASGASPLETIIREADEEASLPRELVRTRIRSAGVLTYLSVTQRKHGWPGEEGLVVPDVIYTYEMELPEDVVPKPKDGEVGAYKLMSVGDVQSALLAGDFKPDAAVVVVDFLIRHGVITAENERNFVAINMHLHRRLPFRIAGG
ncbi:hypothetical protein F5Y16DRAFT_362442 [Xylariaceae sp. FL0255]|nr:hypothetical protein F5Y16DRAFT_362442 [Xylariaceae sp. FL0255]